MHACTHAARLTSLLGTNIIARFQEDLGWDLKGSAS